jgi:formylglycine-generating enzyme required for sulfatase activity
LEVAPLGWQNTFATATSTDLLSNWSTATSTVEAFGTTTAAAGQWRLPTANELETMANLSATDQAKVNGFRDATSAYWTSTEGYGQLANRASVGSDQNPNIGTKSKTLSYYSRPIHTF